MEAQAGRVMCLQARAQLAQDAALADARLAGEQHHLSFPVLRQVPALHQKADLVLAADEAGQPTDTDRFEAALRNRNSVDRPDLDRIGNALDRVPAEVAQRKAVAKQLARRGWKDDTPGLCQSLQSRGQVRRLTDNCLFP